MSPAGIAESKIVTAFLVLLPRPRSSPGKRRSAAFGGLRKGGVMSAAQPARSRVRRSTAHKPRPPRSATPRRVPPTLGRVLVVLPDENMNSATTYA